MFKSDAEKKKESRAEKLLWEIKKKNGEKARKRKIRLC